MLKIGLTGSIGMGKSTAATMFADCGLPIFDSDQAVRRLTGRGGAAESLVASHYPDCWNLKERKLDKEKLFNIVFDNESERLRLEALLHPLVWEEQEKFVQQARRLGYWAAVFDIPLLFETGAERKMTHTVVVTAPPFIQYQRVMARPGMTEEKFFLLLETQMPDHQKKMLADYVVNTGAGLGKTCRSIKSIVNELRKAVAQPA